MLDTAVRTVCQRSCFMLAEAHVTSVLQVCFEERDYAHLDLQILAKWLQRQSNPA
jgi:hypothetical protein